MHLPYCVRKCPYCDFNTYAVTRIPEERYRDALAAEIEHAATQPPWNGRNISTVFFGGGTPSLFSAASLASLLELLDRRFGIEADADITMEANPGSLEGAAHRRLGEFRAAGMNRISFGVQSLHPQHLETLGRIHSSEDAIAAVGAARRAGFPNISCDLIFAIPGQTLAEWRRDLRKLIDLGTDHVSAYGLTYEEGTALTGMLRGGHIEAAPEELELEMFEAGRRMLTAAGFQHYEISNFARPGRRCRHNLTYWTWGDYLGLGAGAHGFAGRATTVGDDAPAGHRYANERIPELYMAKAGAGAATATESVDRAMAIAEYLMLGLRLLDGIDMAAFRDRFGAELGDTVPAVEELEQHSLVTTTDGRFRLTGDGLVLADSVISKLATSVDPG
jgi:oxygen-independent coproporphyrinogen-3 oxidase